MSTYKAARQLCRLTQAEASIMHQASAETIESWDDGRDAAPMDAWLQLSSLYRQVEGTEVDITEGDAAETAKAMATLIALSVENDS